MFASDRVGVVPGGEQTIEQAFDGIEPAQLSMLSGVVDIHGHPTSHRLRTQWPVAIMPRWGGERGDQQTPHEYAPGDPPGGDRATSALARFITATRKQLGDMFTARNSERGPLTGSHYSVAGDRNQSGVMIEPAPHQDVNAGPIVYGMEMSGPDATQYPAQTMGAPEDNITYQQQGSGEETAAEYVGFNHAFPNARLSPMPEARNIVLTSANAMDMNVPDGAVAARFTWSSAGTNDLIMCITGQAIMPTAAIQTGNTLSGNDGMILNPDPTAYYPVRRKKQISFLSPSASGGTPIVVSGQFFKNS